MEGMRRSASSSTSTPGDRRLPLYRLRCPPCDRTIERVISIKLPLPTRCPDCGEDTLRAVLSPPVILDATPRTLGGMADRNDTALGRYCLEDKRRGVEDWKRGVRPGQPEPPPQPKSEVPDWLSPTPRTDLLSLSPERQLHYVRTGET